MLDTLFLYQEKLLLPKGGMKLPSGGMKLPTKSSIIPQLPSKPNEFTKNLTQYQKDIIMQPSREERKQADGGGG